MGWLMSCGRVYVFADGGASIDPHANGSSTHPLAVEVVGLAHQGVR